MESTFNNNTNNISTAELLKGLKYEARSNLSKRIDEFIDLSKEQKAKIFNVIQLVNSNSEVPLSPNKQEENNKKFKNSLDEILNQLNILKNSINYSKSRLKKIESFDFLVEHVIRVIEIKTSRIHLCKNNNILLEIQEKITSYMSNILNCLETKILNTNEFKHTFINHLSSIDHRLLQKWEKFTQNSDKKISWTISELIKLLNTAIECLPKYTPAPEEIPTPSSFTKRDYERELEEEINQLEEQTSHWKIKLDDFKQSNSYLKTHLCKHEQFNRWLEDLVSYIDKIVVNIEDQKKLKVNFSREFFLIDQCGSFNDRIKRFLTRFILVMSFRSSVNFWNEIGENLKKTSASVFEKWNITLDAFCEPLDRFHQLRFDNSTWQAEDFIILFNAMTSLDTSESRQRKSHFHFDEPSNHTQTESDDIPKRPPEGFIFKTTNENLRKNPYTEPHEFLGLPRWIEPEGLDGKNFRLYMRNLKRKYHPDKNKIPDAEIIFKMIEEALAVLLD